MSVTQSHRNSGASVTKNGGANGELARFENPQHPKMAETQGFEKPKHPKMAETWGEMIQAWPYSTFVIVLNEFCQKFSSLGTVLTLYLLNGLKYTEKETTIIFNFYQIFQGIVPLFGSILADGYIGKYKTILFASVLYSVGKVVMAAASVYNYESFIHPLFDFFGIFLIATAAGGIIPCVASFGGDQFEPYQERMISVFFSIFYASINAGALLSTFILPILRSHSCLDQDSCYPLSFGVSAISMIFAALLFVAGSRWYKKQPPEYNVFGDVYRTIRVALKNKYTTPKSERNRASWLDYYLDTHDCDLNEKCQELKKRKKNPAVCARVKFLDDIKSLGNILVMYLPLPMFWALYDQQYSVWLIQSIQMDCRLWGDVLLLPDQMQIVNPVLILVFILIFESIIYPITSKFVKLTPLRKMCAGGVVASIAFVVSAAVQVRVNDTLPQLPSGQYSFVSVMNTFDNCSLSVTLVSNNTVPTPYPAQHIPSNSSLTNNKNLGRHDELFRVDADRSVSWNIKYTGEQCISDDGVELPETVSFYLEAKKIYYIYVGKLGAYIAEADPKKPTGGNGEFSLSINMALSDEDYAGNLALCRKKKDSDPNYPCNPQAGEDFYYYEINYDDGRHTDLKEMTKYTQDTATSQKQASIYKFKPVRPGKWKLYYLHNTPRSVGHKTMSKNQVNVTDSHIELEIEGQGGIYTVVLTGTKNKPEKRVFQLAPDNTVSILWQIPQIAIITAAEILFSITGYEFAYSQSPKSMKSLMQANWFVTVAAGDLIIIIVALIDFGDMAMQFLIYAAVMMVVIIIFALLSVYYYEYKTNDEDDDKNEKCDEADGNEDAKVNLMNDSSSYGATELKHRFGNGVGLDNAGFTKEKDNV